MQKCSPHQTSSFRVLQQVECSNPIQHLAVCPQVKSVKKWVFDLGQDHTSPYQAVSRVQASSASNHPKTYKARDAFFMPTYTCSEWQLIFTADDKYFKQWRVHFKSVRGSKSSLLREVPPTSHRQNCFQSPAESPPRPERGRAAPSACSYSPVAQQTC